MRLEATLSTPKQFPRWSIQATNCDGIAEDLAACSSTYLGRTDGETQLLRLKRMINRPRSAAACEDSTKLAHFGMLSTIRVGSLT